MELNNSGTIVRNRIKYTGGGSGSSKAVSMTEAEYEALVAENKDDPNTPYYITDGVSEDEPVGGGDASSTAFDDTETQLGVDNVQDAIVAVFQSGIDTKAQIINSLEYSGLGLTEESSWTDIMDALSAKFPAMVTIYANGAANNTITSIYTNSNFGSCSVGTSNISIMTRGRNNSYSSNQILGYSCYSGFYVEKIDFTGFNKLKINAYSPKSMKLWIGLLSATPTANTTPTESVNIRNGVALTTTNTLYEYDITEITGEYYLWVRCIGQSEDPIYTYITNLEIVA